MSGWTRRCAKSRIVPCLLLALSLSAIVPPATAATPAAAAPATAAGASAVPVGAKPEEFEARGITLAVTARDLTLTRRGGGHPFFSYVTWKEEQFRRARAAVRGSDPPDSDNTCIRRIKVTPVAWAGKALSLRETEQTVCAKEAHPAGESRYLTLAVDDRAAGSDAVKPVGLTTWFDERVVFDALSADRLVRATLATLPARPRSLTELVAALAQGGATATRDGHCYEFPPDLPERFTFARPVGDRISVRLGLPGAAVCRERLTEIGILLPLPKALAVPLRDAAARRAGFVLGNAPPGIKTVELELKGAL